MPQAEASNMYLCVSCERTSTTTGCADCGSSTIPMPPELATVRRSISAQKPKIASLRQDLDVELRKLSTLRMRDREMVADARRHHTATQSVPSVPQQAPSEPQASPKPAAPPKSASVSPLESGPAPLPAETAPAPPPPESSTLSIQQILLWMGALLSGAAIVAFTTVAWTTFGLAGRAAILFVITAILMTVPLWLRRRGLTSTAETLAGLATLMVACDAVVLPLHATPVDADSVAFPTMVRLIFGEGVHTPAVLVLVLLVTVIALTYGLLSDFVVPGFVAIGLGLLAAVLGFAQIELIVGSAALATTALMFGVSAWLFGRRATTSARRVLVHTAAAASTAAVYTVTMYVSDDHVLVAATAVTALLLVGVRRLLSAHWRIGAILVAGVVGSLSAAVLAWRFAIATSEWLAASTPVWNSTGAVPRLNAPGWELTCGMVFTTVATAAVMTRNLRRHAYAIGGAVSVATLPPALALPYQYAAPLLIIFAILWTVLALLRRAGVLEVTLGCGGVLLAGYGLGLSLGDPFATLVVLSALAVTAAVQAGLTWIAGRGRLSGFLTGVAVPAGYCAILVVLHLVDLSSRHLTVWAVVVSSVLLIVGALRHAHWYSRATETRWPWFSPPAAMGLAVAVSVGVILAVRAVGISSMATDESISLLVAAYAMAIACGAAVVAAVAPTAATVRAAVAGAVITLILGLAAFATFWHHNALLWYTVSTIVVGAVVLMLPQRFVGARLGSGIMVVATSAVLAIAALSAGLVTLINGPSVLWLDFHTPALLLAMAAAGSMLLPQTMRWPFAFVLTALAAVAAPFQWQLPWWSGPILAVGIAAIAAIRAVFASNNLQTGLFGGLSLASGGYSLATALRDPLHHPPDILARPGYSPASLHHPDMLAFCGEIGIALLLLSAITAVVGYRRRTVVGGAAVACGLALLSLVTVLLGMSWQLSVSWQLSPLSLAMCAMAAAGLGLLVACGLRVVATAYLPWASITVPVMAIAAAMMSQDTPYLALFFAISGLIGTSTAMLMLPNRTAAAIRAGLSLMGVLPALAMTLRIPIMAYTLPYEWLLDVWTGFPSTTVEGLAPAWVWISVPGDGTDVVVLALASATLIVAAWGLMSRRAALPVAAAVTALVLPSIPVALNLAWPTLPLVTVAVAIAAYAVFARARIAPVQLAVCAVTAALSAGVATAGALATATTTILVTALISVATMICASIAVSAARRAAGWLLCGTALTGTVLAAGFAVELRTSLVAFGVLTVSAAFFALRATRSRVIAGAAGSVEVAGHVIAWLGLLLTTSVSLRLAIALVVYGSLLGLLALLSVRTRLLCSAPVYACASTLAAFGAYWLLLDMVNISIVEFYTVPFALATVVAGWMELRRHPQLRSWAAYGAGLCLGLLPSLALVLVSPDEPWRRLGLGVAVVAVLLLGSWRRLQAPVVVSGIILPLLTIREIAVLWTYVPSWLPLAVAGVLLLTFGATFERRRRDLRRLRQAVTAMR